MSLLVDGENYDAALLLHDDYCDVDSDGNSFDENDGAAGLMLAESYDIGAEGGENGDGQIVESEIENLQQKLSKLSKHSKVQRKRTSRAEVKLVKFKNENKVSC